MPQKTIYIREEDLKIFDEAEELINTGLIEENSLSSIIASSLKAYIEMSKKQPHHEFKVIKISTGLFTESADYSRYIEFKGKQLANCQSEKKYPNKHDHTAFIKYYLYLTINGKFLLHISEQNQPKGSEISWYRIYDNIVDVNAPEPLIKNAQESIKDTQQVFKLDL